MAIVILTGKTRKGKNRIHEFGSEFRVLEERDVHPLSNEKGRCLLVESVKNSNYIRWISVGSGDNDFTVKEVP